jgi:hypothetical protein
MKTLQFKKGEEHQYEAKITINGDFYEFGVHSGSSNYWGIDIYKNGLPIFFDGYNNSTKKSWVHFANCFAEDLLEGKTK